MKKGIIFGIGIGILIIGVVVGLGAGSTTGGLPGIGGLPGSEDNQMAMSDNVQVTVTRGESAINEENAETGTSKSNAIEVDIEDGAGSSDQN